jgi:uncharacterized phage protein (TIGR01671 family)
MKTLKFRAWHKTLKQYLAVEGINFVDCLISISKIYNNNLFSFDEVIIEQFTGLFDNNGKEIYEGDIVKEVGFEDTECIKRFGFGRVHSIAWDNHYLQWCCLNKGDIDDKRDLQFVSYKYELEVIGNIHENPELLDK